MTKTFVAKVVGDDKYCSAAVDLSLQQSPRLVRNILRLQETNETYN